ncbi:YbgA family protein [Marinomonas epiphytica]
MIYSLKQQNKKIPVGISACLVGDNVRFNGGHSRSSFCTNDLADFFEYQKFCPEMAAGFDSPRPSLRLEGDPNSPRMVFSKNSEQDVSGVFLSASTPYIDTLSHLDGYILMKKSPSCGLERIKVYQENGHPHMQRTQGLFTQALQKRFPLLPMEEEGRLNDPRLRENFILRVFTHHDYRQSIGDTPSMHKLINFHSRYKYTVMAHSQSTYKALGKLLSGQDIRPVEQIADDYFTQLMTCLSTPANRKNHCNVLMHLVGYLKRQVDVGVRQDILNVVEQYRRGEVNLATPMTLLHHYLKQYGSRYINQQSYFMPYPATLGIRNQI